MTTLTPLRRTPLHGRHQAAGARLVDFAGWEMPVQYSGVIEEHLAVRKGAGLFDVSHMGEIEIRGVRALDLVQRLTCNDASRLADGQAQYSALVTPEGTPVDDVLVYRLASDRFLLCVNASNDAKDFAWISRCLKEAGESPENVRAVHVSDEYAQIAIQGPRSAEILSGVTDAPVSSLAPFHFLTGSVAGSGKVIVSRTGYTGEDGFELYSSPDAAAGIWDALLSAGAPAACLPAGLAARDTLRLEACLALYGNDIDESTTLLEAGLGFIVKLDKGDFMGRPALLRQKTEGIRRKLVGFEMIERGVPRNGYPVVVNGKPAGSVCSGTWGPYVRRNIGLVYLPIENTDVGQEFEVMIRARPVRARVVKTPFFRRGG